MAHDTIANIQVLLFLQRVQSTLFDSAPFHSTLLYSTLLYSFLLYYTQPASAPLTNKQAMLHHAQVDKHKTPSFPQPTPQPPSFPQPTPSFHKPPLLFSRGLNPHCYNNDKCHMTK